MLHFFALNSSISIHALRGEGDVCHMREVCNNTEISIHALRGEGDFDY